MDKSKEIKLDSETLDEWKPIEEYGNDDFAVITKAHCPGNGVFVNVTKVDKKTKKVVIEANDFLPNARIMIKTSSGKTIYKIVT